MEPIFPMHNWAGQDCHEQLLILEQLSPTEIKTTVKYVEQWNGLSESVTIVWLKSNHQMGVSEWVIPFNGIFGTADIGVHVVDIRGVIITYTLE